MSDPWRLEGRAALVTGASRGLGRAIAEELADRGAEVLLVARGEADLTHAVEELRARGRTAHGLVADLATVEGRERTVAAVRSRWNRLDVLVCNAGSNIRKPTLEATVEDWEQLQRTNVESAWGLCQGCFPLLKPAGSVILIGSVSSQRAVRTSTAIYAMTKGALDGLTRFLAAEWGPHGVRVNLVAPWYVATPLTEPVLANPEKSAATLARTPLGRVGTPEDVARAVTFLATDASGWITGVTLPVDGGFLALGS